MPRNPRLSDPIGYPNASRKPKNNKPSCPHCGDAFDGAMNVKGDDIVCQCQKCGKNFSVRFSKALGVWFSKKDAV